MCHITWKDTSVEATINTLEDNASKIRCQLPYNIIMNANESSYNIFIEKHPNALESGEKINLYKYATNEGIECCLWPNLYPYTSWCETTLKATKADRV